MLEKKQNKSLQYLKYFLSFIALVLIFVFKTEVANFLINIKLKWLGTTNPELTIPEREELGALRIENKLLKNENEEVRNEFSVGAIDEKHTPVYLLLAKSDLYGDFYTTIPKDKTVYNGMNILSTGNIVIGQVIEILDNSLKVERLGQEKTFIGTSLEVDEFLELKSLSSGLYVGTVPGGSRVSVGDTIVLKGYPKAVVGTVVEITKSDTSLSNVFVRTPYNIQSKEIFYVIQ